jgi:hypothetical protein
VSPEPTKTLALWPPGYPGARWKAVPGDVRHTPRESLGPLMVMPAGSSRGAISSHRVVLRVLAGLVPDKFGGAWLSVRRRIALDDV